MQNFYILFVPCNVSRFINRKNIFEGQKIVVNLETNQASLNHDKYAARAVQVERTVGLVFSHAVLETVEHIPLEISRVCHFFLLEAHTSIVGDVIDTQARRSPIPSVGLEVKLRLRFSGPAPKTHLMKRLIKYSWEYGGEGEQDQDEEGADDEEIICLI